MSGTGFRKTIFLALIAAGFILQAAAREYITDRAAGARPETPPATTTSPDRETVALETVEKFAAAPGSPAPQVAFLVRAFDPDMQAMYPADAAELRQMAVWQVQILDRNGRKLHYIQGQGRPASPVIGWDGLGANGEPLPGGFYNARLVWQDRAGNIHTTAKATFSLFSQLQYPKFAELKLDLGFLNNFQSL